MKIRTRTGEKDSHRISLPGKTAYIGENANTAKGQNHNGNSTGECLTKRLSWRKNCKMRCYRLLGNKLKETCDLNTGYWVKEQQAQEE
jgi:hypothetical protein